VVNRHPCPCCGAYTLKNSGTLELCPVCWWEDDGHSEADADLIRCSVNGQMSLMEARLHYAVCGAAHPRFARFVRPALLSER